jgi:hypothetical protein
MIGSLISAKGRGYEALKDASLIVDRQQRPVFIFRRQDRRGVLEKDLALRVSLSFLMIVENMEGCPS